MEKGSHKITVVCESLDFNNYMNLHMTLCLDLSSLEFVSTLDEVKDCLGLVLINRDIDLKYLEVKNLFSNGILLLVEDDKYFDTLPNVYQKGIIPVPKSTDMNYVFEILRLLTLSSIKKSKDIDKYKDICLLDSAKAILILQYKMNENDAHKYIVRSSMNFRIPILKTAEMIVKNHMRGRCWL